MSIKLWIDPITGIEGHLALYAERDKDSRVVTTTRTTALMSRGFEVILKGRPPEDAVHIVSRSCGVCGAAHANASLRACDAAAGMTPLPMGNVLRNLGYATGEYVYDHPLILDILEGLAPSPPNVSPTNNRYTNPWRGQCNGPFEIAARNLASV